MVSTVAVRSQLPWLASQTRSVSTRCAAPGAWISVSGARVRRANARACAGSTSEDTLSDSSSALTGLPEYRNGGLLLDLGAIGLRDPALAGHILPVGHQAVVEWRALTVALLDRLAPLVRARLGRSEAELPLSRILEGGTWAAGRAVAAERRPGGGPPLRVESDGTVF